MANLGRWVMRGAVLAALAGGLALAPAGCEDDVQCTSDYDCEDFKVCQLSTNKCETYGCKDCSIDEKCEDNACVPK